MNPKVLAHATEWMLGLLRQGSLCKSRLRIKSSVLALMLSRCLLGIPAKPVHTDGPLSKPPTQVSGQSRNLSDVSRKGKIIL